MRTSDHLAAFLDENAWELPVRRRRKRPGVVDLASNELHHPELYALIGEALSLAGPRSAAGYPSWLDLRESLSAYVGLPREHIALLPGAEAAYRVLMNAFTPRPQAIRLITQWPNFGAIYRFAALRGLQAARIPYEPFHGFDHERLISLQKERPGQSIVWISNPNSPAGCAWGEPEVMAIAEATLAAGNLLIIDEAYCDFAGWNAAQLVPWFDNLVLIRSFSKGFGAAGIRLGYLLGPPRVISYVERWDHAMTVSGPSIEIAGHLLQKADVVGRVRQEVVANREHLRHRVNAALPYRALETRTNFVPIVLAGAGLSAHEIERGFHDNGMRIRNLSDLGCFGQSIAVTIGTEESVRTVVDLLERLSRV